MAVIFLNASSVADKDEDSIRRLQIQRQNIEFVFPEGFAQLRLIEECRALNALEIEDPDNFDLLYDITMQMLVGKVVLVNFITEDLVRTNISKFMVTDRYMNLRSVDIIDSYPILVNWLVEFVAGFLGKKYPRSLESVRETMSERRELTKNPKKEKTVKTSFKQK